MKLEERNPKIRILSFGTFHISAVIAGSQQPPDHDKEEIKGRRAFEPIDSTTAATIYISSEV